MRNKPFIYYAFLSILLILFQDTYRACAEQTAVVLKSQNLSAYNEVMEGFKDECIQNNITIKSFYDLDGKAKVGHKLFTKIREEKPGIVLTIGILATTIAKEEIKDIPIIFCMIINQERFQLKGSNITGITTEVAVEEQLKGYQSILNPIRDLGVIYDPSKTGNVIEDAETKVKGIGMNLIKYEIKSSKNVSEALGSLISRVDALWLLPDSTVITEESFGLIKSTAIANKIPLLCTSDIFVKEGALAAVYSDYMHIGKQAAKLAKEILSSSASSSLGIVSPDRFNISINLDTAEKLGLKLEIFRNKPNVIIYP